MSDQPSENADVEVHTRDVSKHVVLVRVHHVVEAYQLVVLLVDVYSAF